MTTPTKEQIEKVSILACVKQKEISDCSKCFLAIIGKCDLDWMPSFTKDIIIEWEKIKDVDARVEKMCKNNPGIKDFEDFNKAINSPK